MNVSIVFQGCWKNYQFAFHGYLEEDAGVLISSSKLLKRKYFKQVSRLFHGSIIGVGASTNIVGSFNGGLRIF